MTRLRTLRFWTTLLVLGVYGVACVVRAGFYRGMFLEEGVTFYGADVAVLGWAFLFLKPPLWLSWFANPLLLASLVCLWRGRYGPAALWSGVAFGLSLLPLAMLLVAGDPVVRADLALVVDPGYFQAELRLGYFAWVGALGLLFGVAVFEWWRNRHRRPEPCHLDYQEPTDGIAADSPGVFP